MSEPEWDRAALLRRIPLFAALPEAAVSELERRITERRHGSDTQLFAQGDPGSELLIIGEGGVKIFQPGAGGGAEVVVALLRAGEFFGEMSLFDAQPRGASAVTQGETVLLSLQREDFLQALQRTPDAVLHVLSVLSRRLRETGVRLAESAAFDVRERLAKRLSDLAEQDADETPAGRRIRRALSDSDLAHLAGATVERVRREMDRLRRELIVAVDGASITVLKPGDLRDMASGGGGGAGSITLPDWLLG